MTSIPLRPSLRYDAAMAAYELKTYRRESGDPLRQEAIVCFSVPDDDAARAEAKARSRDLSSGRVAVLYDAK